MLIFNNSNKPSIKNIKSNPILVFFKKVFRKKRYFLLLSFLFLCLSIPIEKIPTRFQFLIYRSISKINPSLEKTLRRSLEYGGTGIGALKRFTLSNLKKEDAIDLEISFKNFNKLREKRNKAMVSKILTTKKNDEVNALLIYKGESYPVKVRLKGDFTDNLDGEKWSFRIKVKKDKTFLGMSEFSLQHPKTRNFHKEKIYHTFLKDEGVPSLRYEFLTLKINGKNLGTYALEEHFDKLLIENNKFREGPIIRLSEDRMFENFKKEISIYGSYQNNLFIEETGHLNTEVKTFNARKNFKKEENVNQYLLARNIFEDFLAKKRISSSTFEIEKTAKFFAAADLLNAEHATIWHNMRFYFNPITSRLIPIGFDASRITRPSKISKRSISVDRNPMGIFDDNYFISEYVKHLERFSKENYLKEFFQKHYDDFAEDLSKINRSYPYVRLLPEELKINQKYIKYRLDPPSPLSVRLNINNEKILEFSIANKQVFPINVNRIEYGGIAYIPTSDPVVEGNKYSRLKFKKIKFKSKTISNNVNKPSLNNKAKIYYQLLGSKNLLSKELKISPIFFNNEYNKQNNIINNQSNSETFNFITHDKNNKTAFIQKGKWELDKPLIFPIGYRVIVEEGTEINLSEDSLILVNKGSITFSGTDKSPIKLNGIGKKGGQGLIVLNGNQRSLLRNVNFRNLTSYKSSSLNLMGSITFYNSPVDIEDCKFEYLNSEDALNLFQSNFTLKNSIFSNVLSDGLDLDFSNGVIQETAFYDIGNDAIDLSGSKVNMEDIKVKNAGDKAISVGEASKLIAKNIDISSSRIGLASKDLSVLNITNLSTKDINLCLVAFQKKPEYGPGSIILNNAFNNAECKKSYLLEESSNIKTPNEIFIPNAKNVREDLY